VALRKDRDSAWVELAFPLGLGMKLRGIARFRLLETSPRLRLYISPINIDPARPVLPVSHPPFFSMFLARLIGRFATLGLAEDTWALNEGVLDEEAFLEQAWANHSERERMFFEMLRRTPRGVVACVFDGTDRIQHMFMRYMDEGHPALGPQESSERYRGVIEDTYVRCDGLVGRLLDEVDPRDPSNLIVVMSDHGFTTFRRGINLNAWLRAEGYLCLAGDPDPAAGDAPPRALPPAEPGEWFRHVDWTRTRAFALGLGGIFLNLQGRERDGIVAAGEAPALVAELARKLTGLVDPEVGAEAIRRVHVAEEVFDGPYLENAPHLVVGFASGWRASWDGARGIASGPVFTDNTKAWSGDHCVDPDLVPGRPLSGSACTTERASAARRSKPFLQCAAAHKRKWFKELHGTCKIAT
jgi:hypothetical protein